MAQSSRPDPAVSSGGLTEAEWERVAAQYSGDGVYGDPTEAAYVVAGVGLNVTVKAEKRGSVRGHDWYSGTTDYSHTITSNPSGSTRTDRVVLRLDRANFTVRSAVKTGTPGAGAPILQQDASLHEIPLARVTVGNNASSVTVQREELYIGSRVRPCTSSTRPTIPKRGEIVFETNTGRHIGWTGSSWNVVAEDTGWVALSAGNSSWTPSGDNVGRLKGGWVSLRISVKRINSDLTTQDADGSFIRTVPPELRPDIFHYFTATATGLGTGVGAQCRVEVKTNGEVWVNHLSHDIQESTVLNITCTYPL